jgi:hypothetical protein
LKSQEESRCFRKQLLNSAKVFLAQASLCWLRQTEVRIFQYFRRAAEDRRCQMPSSGEAGSFLESNLSSLTGNDELKYVISDKHDFDWAVLHLTSRNLAGRLRIIFSPNTGSLSPAELASWILESDVPVVLGLQLHKIIWGTEEVFKKERAIVLLSGGIDSATCCAAAKRRVLISLQ